MSNSEMWTQPLLSPPLGRAAAADHRMVGHSCKSVVVRMEEDEEETRKRIPVLRLELDSFSGRSNDVDTPGAITLRYCDWILRPSGIFVAVWTSGRWE